ncbi:MAG TPA: HEXXH motif domain-containing protein [Amycolatopsis sp.]|uniref:HEXXH motif domain-containing protein n=1 Tax=Amycolatopsis sp. TaxID=37632 RepID=UPI002B4A4614|nr:HEXXH motif domain-containing protein [Amycolatopsis sp.]HKS47759.1 HEXXH motif domain-containing protein [Amycolatopsis sp.]
MPAGTDERPNPLQRHTVTFDVFAQTCRGPMPADSLSIVRATQYSRRKLVFRTLLDLVSTTPAAAGPLSDPGDAWRVLASSEERDQSIATEVLMYPTVGAWATRIVRRLLGTISETVPLWTELGYLHSLAAAAAIRSRVPFTLRVPVMHGAVNLPTLGQVRLPCRFPTGVVTLDHDRHGLHVRAGSNRFVLQPEEPTPLFLPARSHISVSRGSTLRLRFEDTDPYREFSSPLPPDRLDDVAFGEWAKLLAEAWDLLTSSHPRYAVELANALTMLTPAKAERRISAASSSAAFGGMLVSAKTSAALLAEAMVHEVQHSKLNALLDLVPLLTEPGDETLYAPWRDDPRSATGLLHGIYAFTSTVEFNRVQRTRADEEGGRAADFLFAQRRAQVREAIGIARRLPGLTPLGHTFIEASAERLAVCERDQVEPDLAEVIGWLNREHRATWKVRHHRVDPSCVDRLTREFLRGSRASREEFSAPEVRANHRKIDASWRDYLLKLRILDPAAFARVLADRDAAIPPVDRAFVERNYLTAAVVCVDRIERNPRDGLAWIGLGLSLRAQGDDEGATGILDFPELTMAIHEQVHRETGMATDPVTLAGWVGRAAGPTTA